MLSSDFSMLAPAAPSTVLSSSSVAEKLLELSLSALAICRIELEMASCSARCWSRMASAVAVDVSGLAGLRRLAKRADRAVLWAEGVGDEAEARARSVCVVCVEGCSLVMALAVAVPVVGVVVGGSGGVGSACDGGSGASGLCIASS